MGDRTAKDLRKQLKPLVKELLAEVVTKELLANIKAEVARDMEARLQAIETHIRAVMEEVNARSEAASGFLIRQATLINSVKPGETTPKA